MHQHSLHKTKCNSRLSLIIMAMNDLQVSDYLPCSKGLTSCASLPFQFNNTASIVLFQRTGFATTSNNEIGPYIGII